MPLSWGHPDCLSDSPRRLRGDGIQRLSKLQGNHFDREFEAKNGREADVRQFATDALPDLKKHLSQAEELSKTVIR